MEAAEEKLLKAYKAKAKQWRRQVGQYRRAKQKQTKVQGKKPAPVKIAEGVEPDRKAAREWLRSVKGRLIKTGETVTIAGHELDVIDVNCPIPPERSPAKQHALDVASRWAESRAGTVDEKLATEFADALAVIARRQLSKKSSGGDDGAEPPQKKRRKRRK